MIKKILLLFVITSLPCITQWRWINPTTNNYSVNEIKFYDNFITIAGEEGSLLISTDIGGSWESANDYGKFNIIKTHFLNIDTGYILKFYEEEFIFGVDFVTKFRVTTDKGRNWSDIEFTQNYGYIQDLCFYKNNIYLSFYEGAGCLWFGNFIYQSSDYGNSWNEIEARDLGYCSNMLAINESTIVLLSNNVRISYNYFIVKSTDYGQTWSSKHTLSYPLYDLKIIDESLIVGGGYGGIIVKSQDKGESWTTSYLPVGYRVTKIAGSKNNLLALAKSSNKVFIYRSTNQGSNWIKVFETDTIFNVLAYRSNDEFWLGGRKGKILRSTDAGTSWKKFNYLYDQNFNSVYFKSKSEGFIVGDNGTILMTSNNGATWSNLQSPTNSNLVDIIFYPHNYLGFLVSSNGTIFRTVNGGIDWLNVYSNNNKRIKKLSFITNEIILAAGDSNLVLLSTNSGFNWVIVNNNIDVSGRLVNISIPDPACILLGYENVIFKSTDTAKTWNRFYNSSYPLLSFYFPKKSVGYVFSKCYDRQILIDHTTNSGINWTSKFLDVKFHNLSNFESFFLNDTVGYLIGSFLVYTTNNGKKWEIDYSVNGNDIFVQDSLEGWIVGNYGAIITNINSGYVITPPFSYITEYKLYQNYPNPFNMETIIEYEIPNDTYVVLKIYDILGKEVDRLVDKFQTSGKYSVSWRPKNLPSGIYFYILKTDGYYINKKMCLIK